MKNNIKPLAGDDFIVIYKLIYMHNLDDCKNVQINIHMKTNHIPRTLTEYPNKVSKI